MIFCKMLLGFIKNGVFDGISNLGKNKLHNLGFLLETFVLYNFENCNKINDLNKFRIISQMRSQSINYKLIVAYRSHIPIYCG